MQSTGHTHYISLTGQQPYSWYIRWDNTNIDESAILNIWIQSSNVMNVFIGSNINDNFQYVAPITIDTYIPSLSAQAGYV